MSSFLNLLLRLFVLLSSFWLVKGHADEFVGSEKCVACHQWQTSQWKGSHHDLSMQHVNNESVLGDFSGKEYTYAGTTSRFYTRDGKYYVETDGSDGKLKEFKINYVFGVYPLQQYLVELERGRLQALGIAWDTRPKEEGGQKWFHLYPDEEITYKDELHWSRPSFNWNSMCASCHSTNLAKNYNSESDAYNTGYSDINVACEACHGPASAHLRWVNKADGWQSLEKFSGFDFRLDERMGVNWVINPETGNAVRNMPRSTNREIEICAPCHSRRTEITSEYTPGDAFLDHYDPRLLDEGLYVADGQIQDEVFVYGSFLQSKMYHEGVTCSDCHEPHSLELRIDGNGVCLQCHSADKFNTESHHHHKRDSSGALCAECHMPPRTYMVVDPRHDHSFRIPRPDLSMELGVPNACNTCHADKDVVWAYSNFKKWYGPNVEGFQKFAGAFNRSRTDHPEAMDALLAVINDLQASNIAKATAITLLPNEITQESLSVIINGLQDNDAIVRRASITALEGVDPKLSIRVILPLLDDPVRVVRVEAARVLAAISLGDLQGEQRKTYLKAMDDYLLSQKVNADRPEAQFNLGIYHSARRNYDKAVAAYKTAIELDEKFSAAYINLADVYRANNNEEGAEAVLQTGLYMTPDEASLHHAYGLLLVRKQKIVEAVQSLRRSSELQPNNERYIYTYAIALDSIGESDAALKVLQDAYDDFPYSINILSALVKFHHDAGNVFASETYLRKLQNLKNRQP